jgi:hypothetical protein
MADLERLKTLLANPMNYEYFFKKLEKPGWFDFLNSELQVFNNIPEPELVDDGRYVQYPVWWPGKYLIKVADKIPEKVAKIIKKIDTKNCLALDDAMQAFLNIPVSVSKDLIYLIDRWLNLTERAHGVQRGAFDLLGKFIKENEFDAAIELLDILSKCQVRQRRGHNFRIEFFYFKEMLKKDLPELMNNCPIQILTVIEKRLKEAIWINLKEETAGYDGSSVWRPAIEDNPQNWEHDNIRDILAVALRDALEVLCQKDLKKINEIIERYLKEPYPVFKRLAIHTVRMNSSLDSFVKIVLMDREKPDDHEIFHEFALLLKDKFNHLSDVEKIQFLEWIINGPERKSLDRSGEETIPYQKHWQYRRLYLLRSYLEQDGALEKYLSFLHQLEKELGGIETPEFLITRWEWTGPTSPKSEEKLASWGPNRFIDYIKTEFKPTGGWCEDTPIGLARILEKVVKENPAPYAQIATRFLEEGIWPAYISGLIRGLELAWKDGKDFPWESVIKLCEKVIKITEEPVVKNRRDEFDFGTYSWARGSVADLLKESVIKDSHPLPEEFMDRARDILIYIINNDGDPTPEDERQYGPESTNRDYVTFAINHNRGRAMHALIHHVLRRVRMRSDKEKEAEEGKGPFPPGERLDPVVKELLDKRSEEEISPSVQSTYGEFLPFLYYLDQEWVEEKLREGALFPKDPQKKLFWEAYWQGYIGFNNFDDRLYELLKEDYRLAIQGLDNLPKTKAKRESHYDERLAEHLMIAYLRNMEKLEDKKGLLNLFFNKAPAEIRVHAVYFLSTVFEGVKQRECEEWTKLKRFWEFRVKNSKDEELSGFASWYEHVVNFEPIDNLKDFIRPTIPFILSNYGGRMLLEYLDKSVGTSPITVLDLLIEAIKSKESVSSLFFEEELIRQILTKTRNYKQNKDVADRINEAINLLGKLGYYNYRDLLI